jgi:hypothetical protein
MSLASGCIGNCLANDPSAVWFPPPTPQVFLTISHLSAACFLILLFASLVQVYIFWQTPGQLLQRKSFIASCGVSICTLVLALGGQVAYGSYGQMDVSRNATYSDWAQHLRPDALAHMSEVISWYSIAGSLTLLASVVLLCILSFQAFIHWPLHPRE